jgi:hypothetical protein
MIPVVFQGVGQAKSCVRREWRPHRPAGLAETRMHGQKGTNLPSFFPDRRWPGVHVAVAAGCDRRAVILSTIVANNLRGMATSPI